MSLEIIKLPDFLIVDLYKNTLVELDNLQVVKENVEVKTNSNSPINLSAATAKDTSFKILGENRKNITVLVKEAKAEFINETDLTFLTNILKACYLSPADIAIVNMKEREISYSELSLALSPTVILLFNVEPEELKLPFVIPQFQLQQYDNCTYMLAPPLQQINQNNGEGKLLKTKLWMSLKTLFNV